MTRPNTYRFTLVTAVLLSSLLLAGSRIMAQSKKQREVMSQARLLEKTVFGTKDSMVLEKLFANTLSYVHSSGKEENRSQAIRGIVSNASTYEPDGKLPAYQVKDSGDSVIVQQVYRAHEKKADGTVSLLHISIETVWAKESGQWRLYRRQARKVQ